MGRTGSDTADNHPQVLRIGNAIQRNNRLLTLCGQVLQSLLVGLVACRVDIAGDALVLLAIAGDAGQLLATVIADFNIALASQGFYLLDNTAAAV